MQFNLTIELGNDAMQADADVADALSNVVYWMDSRPAGEFETGEAGIIRDINGNTVGRWEIVN
jgi:hypothetical protein